MDKQQRRDNLLCQLAEEKTKVAQRDLADRLVAQQNAKIQQEQLLIFRHDYEKQLSHKTSMRLSDLSNHKAFVEKINQSIKHQLYVLNEAEFHLNMAREKYTMTEAEKSAMTKLRARHQTQAEYQANKREQRLHDERSQRNPNT